MLGRDIGGGQGPVDAGGIPREPPRPPGSIRNERSNPTFIDSNGQPQPYFSGGWEQATPEEIGPFIFDTFFDAGLSEQEAQFAIRVATGESSLRRDAVGDDGHSFGVWQLFDEGLLPDFYEWADRAGEDANPNNPISATRYVAQFVASGGPAAWNNWTVARQIQQQGQGPFDTDSRSEFPSERGLREAQTTRTGELTSLDRRGLRLDERRAGETERQNAFNRTRDFASLQEGQDDRASVNRRAAVTALIQSLPFTGNPGNEFAPGFEPRGAAATLSRILGAGFTPQRIGPSQTIPLNALANQPNSVSQELMALLAAGL